MDKAKMALMEHIGGFTKHHMKKTKVSPQSWWCKLVAPILLGCVLAVFSSVPSSAVIYKKYYEGLPDYEKNSPFTSNDPGLHSQLESVLKAAAVTEKACAAVPINDFYALDSNVCKASDTIKIKSVLGKIAPALDPKNLALWKADLDSDGQPELLVGYLTNLKETEEYSDPYFTLWFLKKNGKIYKVVHVGPFLQGRLHTIRSFGPFRKDKTVFVKFLSCTECEPSVYLLAVNFGASKDGSPFEFTYSEDHKSWGPTLEYELPGMGHTVDAEVETRIPSSIGPTAPHLIQKFNIEAGKTIEWWVFTCTGLRCDYKMTTGQLPAEYKIYWDKAEKL
jgi:hypothetical protein